MKISLMVDGANDIFLSNYSFFSSTMEQMKIVGLEPLETEDGEEHHHHHMSTTIPKFYFDFEKVLKELKNKGVDTYPDPTNFKIEFIDTATKANHALNPKIFAEVDFKLVVFERVNISSTGDDSETDN
jgi:hypothetical protein